MQKFDRVSCVHTCNMKKQEKLKVLSSYFLFKYFFLPMLYISSIHLSSPSILDLNSTTVSTSPYGGSSVTWRLACRTYFFRFEMVLTLLLRGRHFVFWFGRICNSATYFIGVAHQWKVSWQVSKQILHEKILAQSWVKWLPRWNKNFRSEHSPSEQAGPGLNKIYFGYN